ncbi:MAG: Hsp20/alpha crystallin family protein [Panacagrimonas sp.]
MTLVSYQPRYRQPFSLHQKWLQEVNRYFDAASAADAPPANPVDWCPAVDVQEYADRFVIHADVPGIDPATIDITLEKGVLTLAGTREAAAEKADAESRRTERPNGKFHRRFTLPDTADADAISANGKNGVLEVVLPKRAQVQPRRIAVTH